MICIIRFFTFSGKTDLGCFSRMILRTSKECRETYVEIRDTFLIDLIAEGSVESHADIADSSKDVDRSVHMAPDNHTMFRNRSAKENDEQTDP